MVHHHFKGKGHRVSHLCSLILFFCSPWCSNPNTPVASQRTTALIWCDHIHDMQGLFCVLSGSLRFVCFIMGISLCSWCRWQTHVCRSKITSYSISRRLLWPLGYNYLNLPTGFSFKLPHYGYWIISFYCKTWLPPFFSHHFSINNLCIVTVSFTQKVFNYYVIINEYVVVRNLTLEILSKRIFTAKLGKADRIFT